MNIAALLAKSALSYSSRPAITWGLETWSDYAGFHRAAGSIGGALKRDYGLEAGDRVIVEGLQKVRPGVTVSPVEKQIDQQTGALIQMGGAGQ